MHKCLVGQGKQWWTEWCLVNANKLNKILISY
jgi:hypothetical protein